MSARTVGSVCSGLAADAVAWGPLGWQHLWFAEIEPFPSRVLAHHYPGVRNLGDMTTIEEQVLDGRVPAPDVLVGGTPCQSFSVAGLRGSLSDARGNLALAFVRLANAIDRVRLAARLPPLWVVWENVPGVLSTPDNAFGAFLGGLCGSDAAIPAPPGGSWPRAGVVAGPGRGAAWRVLDAQFLGVAQRRERVFVLARGGARAWDGADALLPLIESVRWHPEPRREAGEGAAARAGGGSYAGGVSPAVTSKWAKGTGGPAGDECQNLLAVPALAHTLTGEGFDASEDGTGRGTPLVPVARALVASDGGANAERDTLVGHLRAVEAHGRARAQVTSATNRSRVEPGRPMPTLAKDSQPHVALAFHHTQDPISGPRAPALSRSADGMGVLADAEVRRLTPRECERLQAFPDDYTAIPGAKDAPRYKALGNAMCVAVMRYLGERIEAVEGGAL